MSSPHIFVRRETELERKARGAVFWDDTDLLLSPRDGALVVAPMKRGVHCCQACGAPVNFQNGIEHTMGFARLLMHPGCIDGAEVNEEAAWRAFMDKVEGQQYRRELAKAARASAGIVEAASEAAGRIIE